MDQFKSHQIQLISNHFTVGSYRAESSKFNYYFSKIREKHCNLQLKLRKKLVLFVLVITMETSKVLGLQKTHNQYNFLLSLNYCNFHKNQQ